MRALLFAVFVLTIVACEKSSTEVAPAPTPSPPGPQPVDAEVVPPPVKTLPRQELEEVLAILEGTDRTSLLEFKQKGQLVTIKGESASADDLAQFSKRLAASRLFAEVTPVSGQRTPQGSYRFEIRAKAPLADPAAPVLTETFTRPK